MNNIFFCYTVYMHVNSINGKRYIGITKQKPVDQEGRRQDFESIKDAAAFYREPILTKNFKVIAESGRIVNGRQWYYKEAS